MGQAIASKVPGNLEALIQRYNLLGIIHRSLDQGLCELEQTIGRPICIENCGKCCEHNTPVVAKVEAQYVLSLVSPGLRRAIDQALDWLEFNHSGLNDNHRHPAEVLQSKQCPFLESDKTCLIYAARPLVCRAYGVTIPQDDWCPRPLHYTESLSSRMIIGRDTDLGRAIASITIPEREVYFLPTLIAKLGAPHRFRSLKIQSAKLIVGRGNMDLFYRQKVWDALDQRLP